MSDYCIIDIIGSIPDEMNQTNKIDGYCQPTNAILIKNFAEKILAIPDYNVKIYAYGQKSNYDVYVHTNNQCYFQLDLEHYYKLDINTPPNFKYMNFKEIYKDIEIFLEQNSLITVLIFLDDHGDNAHFANLSYFALYGLIMKYPQHRFLIFNDSCYSGGLADIVKWYNFFYQVKQKNNYSCIDKQVLMSFSNLFVKISEITEMK